MTRFDARWNAAELRAGYANADCTDTTPSGPVMQGRVDTAVDALLAEINGGLDPENNLSHRHCSGGLARAAGNYCKQLLRYDGLFIKDLERDPDGTRLDQRQSLVRAQFASRWGRFASCPTLASEAGVAGQLEALSSQTVTDSTISPNVPSDVFMAVTHPTAGQSGHQIRYERKTLTPQCQDSSAYSFFAKRGTENKLLVYYVGGGACWDNLTCGTNQCTQNIGYSLAGQPDLFGGGFGDLSNPANPFRDWHIVVVPYCSCDVHWGDAAVDYTGLFPDKHVEHRGYDNARLVEKWIREHFLTPTDVFVTGTSAGAYGATLHGVFLSQAYPTASVNMLADAGNGVITQEFLEENFGNWGVEPNLPRIPGILGVPLSEQSIPKMFEAAAEEFPNTNWAHYTTAFDGGGGGQTGFYNIMLNPDDVFSWFDWWNASCQFNDVMRQQATETVAQTAGTNNYRYYIASGSRHGGFGLDRAYDDTTGGVPTLVSWVNEMIDDGPGWTNVEASPFNVLFSGTCSAGSDNPGDACHFDTDCPNGSCQGEDPNAGSLVPPFEASGADVVISCTP
ncbi:MAG: hypothetical protein JRH10_12105 [Deltaproteobacteria bacterium]|nr:hypothetical protein [Deltaproteobacteria bacterium]